jgi:hypothetical protein
MSYQFTQGSGTVAASDIHGTPSNVSSGNHVPFFALATGTLGALALATEANPAFVSAQIASNPSANFTRPSDTTAYASGDLVANSTTAGSVTPLSWTAPRYATGSGQIKRVRLSKSNTTTTNAQFRVHFYTSSPTIANGDNAAWSTSLSGYLGSVDCDMTGTSGRVFTDAAGVVGVPAVGTEITFDLSSGSTIYGLVEARAAYTPANAEVFTCVLEIVQF